MGTLFKRTAAVLAVAVAAVAVNAPISLTAEAAVVGGCGDPTHSEYELLNGANLTDGSLSGKYCLIDNVQITDEITINNDVTICLSGRRIISMDGKRVFNVAATGSLTICDCDGFGMITSGNDEQGGNVCVSGGTFTLEGGTIIGGTAKRGGGVYVQSGTFTMNNGIIRGNEAKHQGGGVFVSDGGTFIMNGGMIFDNRVIDVKESDKTTAGGGGVYTAGKFTMNRDAEIFANASQYFGGGVLVSGSNAIFTLENGTISGNEAGTHGGGVHVSSNGKVEMNGGTIGRANIATGGGGGVSMGGGEFTMKGGSVLNNNARFGGGLYLDDPTANPKFTLQKGTISGNEATGEGGAGLYLSAGNFDMTGGTISDNKATGSGNNGNGGGIYLRGGTLNMIGGAISGNEATRGSCVYMDSGSGALTLNGRVTITSASDSNVYLKTGKTITIGSKFSTANPIGIHPETPPADCKDFVPAATFAEGTAAKNISAQFKADRESQFIVYEADKVQLRGEHNYDTANWVNDENTHWHKCTICDDKKASANHIWDKGTVIEEPTPGKDGSIKFVCTVCDAEKTSPLRLKSPSSSSSSGNRVTSSDEDNSAASVPKNPPTGHNAGASAVLAIAALAAALTRKRR